MFRNPRETDVSLPSTGRPPTPPGTPHKTPFTLTVPPSVPAPKMAVKAKVTKQTPLPTIGRQGAVGSAKKATATAKVKQSGKANSSILSFFKKTDGPLEDGGLFVQDGNGLVQSVQDVENQTPPPDAPEEPWEDEARFNERGGSVKRRRTSVERDDKDLVGEDDPAVRSAESEEAAKEPRKPKSGPFMEESDSEEDGEQPEAIIPIESVPATAMVEPSVESATSAEAPGVEPAVEALGQSEKAGRPPLIKQETSYAPDPDEFQDFEGMEDFDEDLYEQGDEFVERRYMQEQAALEDEDEKDYDPMSSEAETAIKQGGYYRLAYTC